MKSISLALLAKAVLSHDCIDRLEPVTAVNLDCSHLNQRKGIDLGGAENIEFGEFRVELQIVDACDASFFHKCVKRGAGHLDTRLSVGSDATVNGVSHLLECDRALRLGDGASDDFDILDVVASDRRFEAGRRFGIGFE